MERFKRCLWEKHEKVVQARLVAVRRYQGADVDLRETVSAEFGWDTRQLSSCDKTSQEERLVKARVRNPSQPHLPTPPALRTEEHLLP